jgi:hypothetical protein
MGPKMIVPTWLVWLYGIVAVVLILLPFAAAVWRAL